MKDFLFYLIIIVSAIITFLFAILFGNKKNWKLSQFVGKHKIGSYSFIFLLCLMIGFMIYHWGDNITFAYPFGMIAGYSYFFSSDKIYKDDSTNKFVVFIRERYWAYYISLLLVSGLAMFIGSLIHLG